MGSRHFWTGGSRRLASLLLAVVVPPAVTLVWLGLRLLDQDRVLVAQRELEHRQVVAQSAARSLGQSLAAAERGLSEDAVPDGTVRFTLSERGVQANPATRVLWVPVPPALLEAATRPFADAERLEFRGDAGAALTAYQTLAESKDAAVRAGALLRVARVHRARQHWTNALAAYGELGAIRAVAIDGMPADLLARRAAAAVLSESGRKEDLSRDAVALETSFLAGRWMLDRSAWEVTAADIGRWVGRKLELQADRQTFSSVADALWTEWRAQGPNLSSTRRVISVERTPITVLARAQGGEVTALAIPPGVLNSWVKRAAGTGQSAGEPLGLLTALGDTLAGAPPADGALRLSPSETGLPWTLAISPGSGLLQTTELAGRRRLLFVGLAAILLLLAGGSYFLWRLVRHELDVARLQTDFVAAVSHEFRTPLTSLRHVTELLDENDDMPRERRRSFYEALGRNTERLQRLVESLLDFARMEGGRKPYDPQPMDVREFTTGVVAEFKKEIETRGFDVNLSIDLPAPMRLQADAASLTNALWNLLDNAAKYSPNGHTVHVSVHPHSSGVAIAVRDEGIGVARGERTAIFQRFVRGREASRLGIKGTGLGLAMVSHVVHAHGGAIELESSEGVGSTFTIVLPAQQLSTVNAQLSAEAGDLNPESSHVRVET
jgi:signal transduction histidine kinase